MPASRATASIETAWKPAARRSPWSRRAAARAAPRRPACAAVAIGAMLHLCKLRVRKLEHGRPSTSARPSSAAGSPGSAWRSASSRRGSRTSSCSSAGTTWAAPGTTTPTRAAPATCPRHLYSFSFAPNPGWSETYSRQPEIRDYLRRCADDLRRPRARAPQLRGRAASSGTRPPALDARDHRRAAARPRPRGRHGPARRAEDAADSTGSTTSRARRSTPRAGTTTTTCRGKRVAVVGTGASAIQFVPEIQTEVEQLHVIQRTPPWVMPHPNRPISRFERAALQALPAAAEARARRRLRRARAARARLRQAPAADEAPRADRAPAHGASRSPTPSCSRRSRPTTRSAASGSCPRTSGIRALGEPNVELLTGGVERSGRTRSSPATASEREVDAIIFGTGFQVTDMPVGRHGARTGRPDARRGLAGQPAGAPRHRDARLPEPVRAARPEHRPRALLDGLHDRVAGRLRDGRAAPHGRAQGRHRAGARRRGRALQRRPRRAHAGHGLEHGLRELVPRRDGAQRDAVARLDLALPPAHRALRPRRLRARSRARRRTRSR